MYVNKNTEHMSVHSEREVAEQVTRESLERLLGTHANTKDSVGVVEEVQVVTYDNGDVNIRAKLSIPSSRIHVTIEGSDAPVLIGCADEEL
jgi:hypothetical protein